MSFSKQAKLKWLVQRGHVVVRILDPQLQRGHAVASVTDAQSVHTNAGQYPQMQQPICANKRSSNPQTLLSAQTLFNALIYLTPNAAQ